MLTRAEAGCFRKRVTLIARSAGFLLGASLFFCSTIASASLDYLAAQQNPDGSFGGTPTSLATPVQSTAEVLRAHQLLGEQSRPAFAPAFSFLVNDPEQNTEFLSRKVQVTAASGIGTGALVTQLLAHRNADGGFGNEPELGSSLLDTAFALQALAAAGYSNEQIVGTALGYLLNRQQSNGGWANGDNASSVYTTATVFRALWPYRDSFNGVRAALTGGQNFLLAQRGANGAWQENFETALALLALVPNFVDLAPLTTPPPRSQPRGSLMDLGTTIPTRRLLRCKRYGSSIIVRRPMGTRPSKGS